MIIYNCGAERGCSRIHKHLQAIRKEALVNNP